jgi:hypothetical protein
MIRIKQIKRDHLCRDINPYGGGYGYDYKLFQKSFKCKCGKRFVSLKMMEYHHDNQLCKSRIVVLQK